MTAVTMSEDQIDTQKAALRREITQRLLSMTADDRHDKSLRACRRVTELEVFQHASTLMMYMPLPAEVDVTPVAMKCFQLGMTVCVPRVDWRRKDMSAVEVQRFDDSEMDIDDHGLRTPRDGRLVIPSLIDLVILPGLAFDVRGNRLGRGGGYYDRFLSRVSRTTRRVAVCFDEQIVDAVPVINGDMRVDMVITDRRATRTGRLAVR